MVAPASVRTFSDRRRSLGAVAVAYLVALLAALGTGWAVRDRGPLLATALADLAGTLVVFAFSVRHDNSSVYDPYWSVAPLPLAVSWAVAAGEAPGLRAVVVLVLVAAWGVRLTANWVTRWQGLGDEDFRYREIRQRTGRLYWPASLVSIHLLPSAWVFLGLLPVWPALSRRGRPPGALDLLAVVVTAGAIALESAADLQLRRFLRARRDPSAVLESGLWRWSRHPNYLGEMGFWWGLWLFGVSADPAWAWTAVGPLAITLLFLGVSIPWMDRRLRARHPGWGTRSRSWPASPAHGPSPSDPTPHPRAPRRR